MRVFVLSIGTMLLSSCGYYHEDYTKGFGVNGVTDMKSYTTLSYESVREIVFKNNCRDCHFQDKKVKKGVDLGDYNIVVSKITKIQDEVRGGTMPPPDDGFSPVPADQQEILLLWIQNKMPLTSDIPLPGLKKTVLGVDAKSFDEEIEE